MRAPFCWAKRAGSACVCEVCSALPYTYELRVRAACHLKRRCPSTSHSASGTAKFVIGGNGAPASGSMQAARAKSGAARICSEIRALRVGTNRRALAQASCRAALPAEAIIQGLLGRKCAIESIARVCQDPVCARAVCFRRSGLLDPARRAWRRPVKCRAA